MSYDSTKLDEDKSRVQVFYQEHGYFAAHVTDADVKMRKVGGETPTRTSPSASQSRVLQLAVVVLRI